MTALQRIASAVLTGAVLALIAAIAVVPHWLAVTAR